MVGCQFLALQFVYFGHCSQERLPGWITKFLRVIVLTYPIQQGIVPAASVVIGVVPSNTGNQGRSKSKEPRNSIPVGTERAALINQYVPIILLCEKMIIHNILSYYASLILVISPWLRMHTKIKTSCNTHAAIHTKTSVINFRENLFNFYKYIT